MAVYHDLISELAAKDIDSPRLEARLMLAEVLQDDATSAAILNAELTEKQQNQLKELVARRTQKHEPLDKILGHKAFYKYDFWVTNDVLSPRPDTEILVEEALRLCPETNTAILDLGTGSGCILLSLLKEKSKAQGVGVDISVTALETARKNAERLKVAEKVRWIKADWFAPDFLGKETMQFDIIVSNPPYIPLQEIKELDDEVKLYDPLVALSGGADGYESYHRLAEVIPPLLKDNGYLLLECGKGQAQTVADIFVEEHLSLCKIAQDLQGIDRCIILKK